MTAIDARRDRSSALRIGIGRWAGAGTLVFAGHVLLALAVLYRLPAEVPSDPPAAMLIELEPISAAPAVPSVAPPAPEEIAPPPDPTPVPEVAPEPEPQPEAEPVVEPEPIEPPETEPDTPIVVARLPVARPEPLPEIVPPVPKPVKPKRKPQAKPRESAPAAAPRQAQADAAPNRGASSSPSSPSPDRWQSAVFRHLQRYKRYPRSAEASGVGGTARVRFTIDPNGNVLSRRITGSSGHPELDEAVLSMIERASPLPAPPADLFRPGMSLEVPIRFSPR